MILQKCTYQKISEKYNYYLLLIIHKAYFHISKKTIKNIISFI